MFYFKERVNKLLKSFWNLLCSLRFNCSFKVLGFVNYYQSFKNKSKFSFDKIISTNYFGTLPSITNLGTFLAKDLKLYGHSMISIGNNARLSIGKNARIGKYTEISSAKSISIGDNFLCSRFCLVRDNDGHMILDEDNNKNIIKPIIIGDNVWLGQKVTILKGVKIGNNVVIGTGSLVVNDIPSNSLVVGSPAKVIKKIKKWSYHYD